MIQLKVRGKRFLLNPPGIQSTAAIVAEVEDTRRWKPGCTKYGKPIKAEEDGVYWDGEPDVALQFSDCSRSIRYSFGQWETSRNRRADVYKVDRMIDALQHFRTVLIDEQSLYLERVQIARKIKPTQEEA